VKQQTMNELLNNHDYKNWLIELKLDIQQSQIKAALAVNSQLIQLYWDLGKQITEKQETAKWGSGFIEQLSKDLRAEFPTMSGFSRTNLFSVGQFFRFYSSNSKLIHQLGGQLKIEQLIQQIPWRHHVLIMQKTKDVSEALFYVKETTENSWSRAVLEYQIETNLYGRQGKAITNFKNTLPEIESNLANALLKDPYNFEFLTVSNKVKEQDLERQLVANITQFLLELGKGFAYLGRQFTITVGGKEFKTDLLFYHTRLKCYVVIELKVTEFEPEFLGKLNFYLSAVNKLVKADDDKPTIGILLCKSKNNLVVDFALQDINKPLGVSEYTYTQLPTELREALPTIEQLTEQLNKE
jgi:predicted nuclease of restriction endonuclease-like (RecB) superfamily